MATPPGEQPPFADSLLPGVVDGFADRVIDWQLRSGRHRLPWQSTRDPYRVWLSEIMLQQTQVATVTAYYQRFLLRFADVGSLARAPLDDVFGMWSGLGYYSRARNLHRCAVAVVEQHRGQFPQSAAELAELPGIGRSTAAAIAAFCFGEHVAILDGNVKRVLSRVTGFDGDLAQVPQQRRLWDMAQRLLPAPRLHEGSGKTAIATYTQGLMDLGAGICSLRAPACSECPVAKLCSAALSGEPTRYPVKTRKTRRSARANRWLSLTWRDRLWLVRRPEQGIWAGLWSLCEFEASVDLQALAAAWPGTHQELPAFKHVLTHLDWTLQPSRHQFPDSVDEAQLLAITAGLPSGQEGSWFTRSEVEVLGIPTALRRLLPML